MLLRKLLKQIIKTRSGVLLVTLLIPTDFFCSSFMVLRPSVTSNPKLM